MFRSAHPAAVVTTADGEIGIEVRRPASLPGACFLRQGRAALQVPAIRERQAAIVRENRSVELERIGAQQIVGPVSGTDFAASFPHRILRPAYGRTSWLERRLVGASLKSINADITEGQLFAVGSGEDLEIAPSPASNETGSAERSGPAGASHKSAPSAPSKPPAIGGVTYTSRHMFEVNNVAPDTAVVRGWFVAQGCITAVRFNGKTLSGLQLDDRKAMDAVAFIVQGRLVQNINTLEIDASDAMPSASQGNVRMVVRLRVSGIRLPGQKAVLPDLPPGAVLPPIR